MNTQSEDAKKYPNGSRNAFPTNGRMFDAATGLTKREYFAIKILAGIVSNPNLDKGSTDEIIAKCAVQTADALIEALNK